VISARVGDVRPTTWKGQSSKKILTSQPYYKSDFKKKLKSSCSLDNERKLKNMSALREKIVLITGASQGIGKELAVYFAKEGTFWLVET